MHERRRTERWLAGIPDIKISRKIRPKLLRIADRQLIKEIVGMLAIVERLPVPGFAGLKEKWIAASSFREQIEAHHSAKAELRAFIERMRIHGHEPVGRVDPIVAPAGIGVDVTRENSAMEHEHVVAEHEHASIYWRRVGHPARSGTLAAHRLGDIERGRHRHLRLAQVLALRPTF